MKTTFVSLVSLMVMIGCGSSGAPAPTGSSAQATEATSAPSSVDEALADAETGRDPAASRARLEALLADGTLKKDDHGKVALALSRLVEATDSERAIALTEDAVASGNEAGEKRLFSLLTGKSTPSKWSRRTGPTRVSESAKALAKYYPAAVPGHTVEVEIDVFGAPDSSEDVPNPFDVGAALRQNAIESCGLCETVETSVHTHRSGELFWTAMPRYADKLDKAMVVVYVDAQTVPPARYQKWLAAPIAELEAAIARGEGLIAVKERPGAAPLITIAAPRVSQFGTMETKLSEMSTLPRVPAKIVLPEALAPAEIQGAVRSKFGSFRKCYESLVARKPGAAGKIEIGYAIAFDGAPRDVVVNLTPSLDDAEMSSCVKAAAESITYPAWSKDPKAKTTVKYPIVVSP